MMIVSVFFFGDEHMAVVKRELRSWRYPYFIIFLSQQEAKGATGSSRHHWLATAAPPSI